jgi:hypothetical protein
MARKDQKGIMIFFILHCQGKVQMNVFVTCSKNAFNTSAVQLPDDTTGDG